MSSGKGTTVIGYINPNQQRNLGLDNPNGTDFGQQVYALRCERVFQTGQQCGYIYGANGSDIHLRLCPKCQNGKVGLPLTKRYQ